MDSGTIIFLVLVFSIVGLSCIAYYILSRKLSRLKNNNYIINKIASVLMGFLLFILLEGAGRILWMFGKAGLIPIQFMPIMKVLAVFEIVPFVGLFVTSIFMVYYLMEANIELLAKYEDNVSGFLRVYSSMSKELEMKDLKVAKKSKK